MNEQAFLVACQGEQLLGILNPGHSDLAVLLVVGGPQYRAGSHRLFVKMCRQLAAQGIGSLRFDVRGMGDSTGAKRGFEHLSDDIAAALDALQAAAPQVKRVVLWGLCDGASAALLYCHERSDARVAGLCLVNPWVRSPALQAQTLVRQHYLKRLGQADLWQKVLRGKLGWQALQGLWQTWRASRRGGGGSLTGAPHFAQGMALGLQCAAVPTLITLSGRDFTAREFEIHTANDSQWCATLKTAHVRVLKHPEADHTHSQPDGGQALIRDTLAWLRELSGSAVPSP